MFLLTEDGELGPSNNQALSGFEQVARAVTGH